MDFLVFVILRIKLARNSPISDERCFSSNNAGVCTGFKIQVHGKNSSDVKRIRDNLSAYLSKRFKAEIQALDNALALYIKQTLFVTVVVVIITLSVVGLACCCQGRKKKGGTVFRPVTRDGTSENHYELTQ